MIFYSARDSFFFSVFPLYDSAATIDDAVSVVAEYYLPELECPPLVYIPSCVFKLLSSKGAVNYFTSYAHESFLVAVFTPCH